MVQLYRWAGAWSHLERGRGNAKNFRAAPQETSSRRLPSPNEKEISYGSGRWQTRWAHIAVGHWLHRLIRPARFILHGTFAKVVQSMRDGSGSNNEPLPIVSMSINDPNRSPFGIHG
jgi:hypothetical protein